MLACLLLSWIQGLDPAPATPFDKVIAFEIQASDLPLAGHGRSVRFEYVPEFPGTLHVWTRAGGEIDLFLRVERPEGRLVASDDNSGGGNTPCVVVEVAPSKPLIVIVALASSDESSSAGGASKSELHLVAAPETEATRAAAAAGRTAVGEIRKLRNAQDLEPARALATRALEELLALPRSDESDLVCGCLGLLGYESYCLGDLRSARRAWGKLLGQSTRTLPDEHPEVQAVRSNLAVTVGQLGDLAAARSLLEQVLAVYTRTLSDDNLELQHARANLAGTIAQLGDPAGARVLEQKVLEVFTRTLPDEHPELQSARLSLAATLLLLGDLAGARAQQERVLEIRSRTLPEGHPAIQFARASLAETLSQQGEYTRARDLQEQALEVFARTLPPDHPNLLRVRTGLAATLRALGDLAQARAQIEQVLELRLRTLPAEHYDLQLARQELAVTLYQLGDLNGARTLQEQVLDVLSRTLPDEHLYVQVARGNLAGTLHRLGDLHGARALQEKVLDVSSRALPDDHPSLLTARLNLANTLFQLGDLESASTLQSRMLEVATRTLPKDNAQLQMARLSLARTLRTRGDLYGARSLEDQVLEVFERTLAGDHPDLQLARLSRACTAYELGDLASARALQEGVLEVRSRTLPDDHPELLYVRQNLALTILSQVARARAGQAGGQQAEEQEAELHCIRLLQDICRAGEHSAQAALFSSSCREAEERCAGTAVLLGTTLSLAEGFGVFDTFPESAPASFAFCEATRGAALGAACMMRAAAHSPTYGERRAELRRASDELAALVQHGNARDEFQRAVAKRDGIERELVSLACTQAGGTPVGLEFDLAALAHRLSEDDAVLGFWRYTRWGIGTDAVADASGKPAIVARFVESLCALVLRRPGATHGAERDSAGAGSGFHLTRVELGPIAPIEQAVQTWRDEVGVSSAARGLPVGTGRPSGRSLDASGARLRELVFDPLLPALQGARHLIVAQDDVLHLVPLDALPAPAQVPNSRVEGALVGDCWRIETRVTLAELLATDVARSRSGGLVGVGNVAYDGRPTSSAADAGGPPAEPASTWSAVEAQHSSQVDSRQPEVRENTAAILRGGAWSGGFAELPATGAELRGIAGQFGAQTGAGEGLELLEGVRATRAQLLELAPRARWLHIATHGWFAPESIRSWSDAEPLDKFSGLGRRLSGAEQVRGMSPMLLCGLALAGANLPEDEFGRVPGLLTAEELSTLDLTNCELVVLSACDTNVGERRAGQGVHSLQMALQMAGARSVITSLWKVPDEATKELMLDFYRRLWAEKKPKWQALWARRSSSVTRRTRPASRSTPRATGRRGC